MGITDFTVEGNRVSADQAPKGSQTRGFAAAPLRGSQRPFVSKTPQLRAKKAAVFCSLCLLGSLAVSAFTGPQADQKSNPVVARQKTPTFSVEAAMVVVDVTVRDNKGKLISDLKREDFKIYEDNVPQSIVTFTAEQVAVGAPPESKIPAADAGKTQPAHSAVVNLGVKPDQPVKKDDLSGKRLMILFFDLSSLDTENLIRSVDSARLFLAEQTGPQDLLAVATYSSTLSLVQDLTNDREVLLKTLNSISSTESGDAVSENLGDSSSSEEVYVPDSVQFNIFNTDRRLSALETLAKMYREFPERKSLIYFSGGMSTTGVENNAQIRSTVDNANRSNMSIYTVDSQGLVALPPGGDASQASAGGAMAGGGGPMRQRTSLMNSQETLITLAHDTGGRAFTDSNDLSLAMKQAQADTNIYYVLGYFSTNSKEDGKYRKIRVEIAKPGIKIAHRPGYFAAKDFAQLTKEERDLQLQQAMSLDRPFVDVPLILEVDYFRSDDKTTLVPISMELHGEGLKFEEKGTNREGKFEFVAQATDTKGKVASVARDSVQLRLPAERAEKIKAGGIFYSTGFQLRPGEYKLKFLVRDNVTGKLGTFEQPIQVPAFDLKTLSLSSIVLGNRLANTRQQADSGITRQGSMRRFQEMVTGYDPLVTGGRKVVPSIGNVFLAGQTVYVYFQVYGVADDPETKKPVVETDLMLIRDNTKILETQPQYIEQWTRARNTMSFGRGGRGMGAAPGPGGGPGGPPGSPNGRGFPGGEAPGRMGGPPGMTDIEDRKGETTVAINLPIKNLKRGTYTLQVHVRDTVADVNRFHRIPIVIE